MRSGGFGDAGKVLGAILIEELPGMGDLVAEGICQIVGEHGDAVLAALNPMGGIVTHGVAMGWYVTGPLALKSAMSFSGIPGQVPVNSKPGSGCLNIRRAVEKRSMTGAMLS